MTGCLAPRRDGRCVTLHRREELHTPRQDTTDFVSAEDLLHDVRKGVHEGGRTPRPRRASRAHLPQMKQARSQRPRLRTPS